MTVVRGMCRNITKKGNIMKKKVFLFIMFILLPVLVHAYCSEPSEPFDRVPSSPFCADTFGGVGDCDQWVIDKYKREIEDYIEEWQEYAEDAIDYANCIQNEAA